MALKFRRKKCLIALCVVIFSSCVIIYIFADSELEKAGISFSENCNKALPSRFTSELCRNFTNKIAYGKLCEPLCKSNGIIKSRCIHHGDTIVIFAMWNDNEIVLKWKKPHFYNQYLTLDYFNDLFHVPQNSNMNLRAVWKDLLLNQLESNLGTAIHGLPSETTNAALRGMGAEFTTDARELRSFVPLLSQDEFSMIGIYQELRHFPKLHGYCGQAYAVERLAPYGDLFPSILRKIDWKKRVKMALSFLDLLQELEHAKSGPLHHCDIQEGNFGLTHDFQVKVIDADMIFTEERVKEILAQSNCSKDSDCDFFDCVSVCDVRHRKCLSRKSTTNFQVLCRDIFKSSWPASGLFGRMPSHVSHIISTLLNDCASKRFGYLPWKHRRVQSTLRTLRMVLLKELKRQ